MAMNKKGVPILMVLLFVGSALFSYFVFSSLQSTQTTIYESEKSISQMQENVGSTIETTYELKEALKRSVEDAILDVAWCGGDLKCGVDNPRTWWKGTLIENGEKSNIPSLEDVKKNFTEKQRRKFLDIVRVFLPDSVYKEYNFSSYDVTYDIKYGPFYANTRELFLGVVKIFTNTFLANMLGDSSNGINKLFNNLNNTLSSEEKQEVIDTINVTVSPKDNLTFSEKGSNISINGTLVYNNHFTEFFNLYALLNKTAQDESLNPNRYIYNNLTEFFKGKYCDSCTLHYNSAKKARQYDFCNNESDKSNTEAGCLVGENNITLPIFSPDDDDNDSEGAKNFSAYFKNNLSKSGLDPDSAEDIRCYKDGDKNDPDIKNIDKPDTKAVPVSKATVVKVVNDILDQYEKKLQQVVELNNNINRNWTIKIVNRQIDLKVKHELKKNEFEATVCGNCSVKNDSCDVETTLSSSLDCSNGGGSSSSSTIFPNCNEEAAQHQGEIIIYCSYFCSSLIMGTDFFNKCFDNCNKTLYNKYIEDCGKKVKKGKENSGSNSNSCSEEKNEQCDSNSSCCSICAFNQTKLNDLINTKIYYYARGGKLTYYNSSSRTYTNDLTTLLDKVCDGYYDYDNIKNTLYDGTQVNNSKELKKKAFLGYCGLTGQFCEQKATKLLEDYCNENYLPYTDSHTACEDKDWDTPVGKKAINMYNEYINDCINSLSKKCNVTWTCADNGFTYGKCNQTKENLKASKEAEGYICSVEKKYSASYNKYTVIDQKCSCGSYKRLKRENGTVSISLSPLCEPKEIKAINTSVTTLFYQKDCRAACGDNYSDDYSYSTFFNTTKPSGYIAVATYTPKPVHIKDKYTVYIDQYIYNVYVNYTIELIDTNEQYFAGSAKRPVIWRYRVEASQTFNVSCDPANYNEVFSDTVSSCVEGKWKCDNKFCSQCSDDGTTLIEAKTISENNGVYYGNQKCTKYCPYGCSTYAYGAHCLTPELIEEEKPKNCAGGYINDMSKTCDSTTAAGCNYCACNCSSSKVSCRSDLGGVCWIPIGDKCTDCNKEDGGVCNKCGETFVGDCATENTRCVRDDVGNCVLRPDSSCVLYYSGSNSNTKPTEYSFENDIKDKACDISSFTTWGDVCNNIKCNCGSSNCQCVCPSYCKKTYAKNGENCGGAINGYKDKTTNKYRECYLCGDCLPVPK